MPAARLRLFVSGLTAAALAGSALAATAAPTAPTKALLPVARDTAPVVLTGAQLPSLTGFAKGIVTEWTRQP